MGAGGAVSPIKDWEILRFARNDVGLGVSNADA